MSEIRTLLKQSSHYFTGHIIIMAAGFVSFPILTRIFSVSDYGILGLITTTVFIATSIAKCGIPESIVRYYAEFKLRDQMTGFYATFFLSSLTFAVAVVIIFMLGTRVIGSNFMDVNAVDLLSLACITVFTACLTTTFTSFLRAEQRTKLYNIIAVISRYGSLTLGILVMFFWIKGLYGFYVGQIISGLMTLSLLVYIFREKRRIKLSDFSGDIIRESMKFGFPLVWAELGYLILNYADRYLIQLYMGPASLGLYVAGYNLATYVTEVIIYPMNYAVMPIYMNMLVKRGEEETKQFLTDTFRYFLLIMFPVVLGFIAVGGDLLTILASNKYWEANSILPYVVIGQGIHACSLILNNGLFIRKKTHLVTLIMMSACVVNVSLNLILIPRSGIVGAAQATLISYVFHTGVVTYYAFKEFSFRIDYGRIILYLIASLIMFISVRSVHFGGQFTNLLNKVGMGMAVYICLVILFDVNIRRRLFILAYGLKK